MDDFTPITCTYGDGTTKIFHTQVNFEIEMQRLVDLGYYCSNISYDFDEPCNEDVTMVGNNKKWLSAEKENEE